MIATNNNRGKINKQNNTENWAMPRHKPCRQRRHRWMVASWQTHAATRDDKAGTMATPCPQWMTIYMMNVRWLWSSYDGYSALIEKTEGKIRQGLVEGDTVSQENNAFANLHCWSEF